MAPKNSSKAEPSSYEVKTEKNPIACSSLPSSKGRTSPTLVFTHGAGGDLSSAAMVNFLQGFARELPIVCFKGNMNMKSRVASFHAVMEDERSGTVTCLGGRSMGARAAVLALTDEITHLVLASYPLHNMGQVRDQILLDLPERVKVIFVSGSNDSMCELSRLEAVRENMQCQTWRIVVQTADHGLNVKPKAATDPVGKLAAEVVAQWILDSPLDAREGQISWNETRKEPAWSGWTSTGQDLAVEPKPAAKGKRLAESTESDTKRPKRSKKAK